MNEYAVSVGAEKRQAFTLHYITGTETQTEQDRNKKNRDRHTDRQTVVDVHFLVIPGS